MYTLVQQRVLSKSNTPNSGLKPRTPRTAEVMKGVLEHFPSFPGKNNDFTNNDNNNKNVKEKLNMESGDEENRNRVSSRLERLSCNGIG